MKLLELLEDDARDLVIIYPGRFHPFHIGHGKVYKYLKQKYSNAKVFIATSGKTDNEKSPFTFDEKRKMMMLAGVDSGAIVQTRSPYAAMEIVEMFDPDKTVVIYAISEKDMENEPRFDFSNGVSFKKNGEPAHMQKWEGMESADTVRKHSYIATTPTFPFKIRGAEINSASQIRNMISKSDDTELSQILQDLYNVADIPQDVLEIFKRKIGNSTMNENWNEDLSSAFLLETTPMKINELDRKLTPEKRERLEQLAAEIKSYVDDHKKHLDTYPMDVEVDDKVYDYDEYWEILDQVYPKPLDESTRRELFELWPLLAIGARMAAPVIRSAVARVMAPSATKTATKAASKIGSLPALSGVTAAGGAGGSKAMPPRRTKPLLQSVGNTSEMQAEYKSNEDNNAHSRNIYMLAKEFGTPEEVSEIEKLLKVITRQGYKTPEQSQVMYDMIHTPYYSKLFPSVEEGYTVLPSMDREKYQERPGLEGPFTLRSGKVVYYDVAEGAYYDSDSDIYLSYEEYQAHDDIPHKQVNEAIGKLNKNGEIEMTKANYVKIHKDFKSKIDGTYMAMQIDPKTGGTALFPVKFIKELTDSVDHFSSIATEIAIKEGADRDSTEYKAGAFAAKHGKAYDSNPHKPGRDRLNWSMGHNEYRANKLRKAGKPNYGARGQFESK